MNPSPTRHAVIVGLFVAVAISILAGGIMMIGDLNDTFTPKITVTTIFDEVNGLKRGDSIWFSGLKVGRVTGLGFHDGAQVAAEMKIDKAAAPFIHQDALVKIGSDGLIGNRILVVYGGTAGTRTLQEGDELAVGKSISNEEVITMLQENNTNLLAITTDLRAVTGKLATGQGTIGRLLQDDTLYATLLDTVSTLNTASENSRTLTASLSTFASLLNRKGGLPNDLVTDRTTYASLVDTVGRLNHASERTSDLMDGLALGAGDPNTPIGTLMRDKQAGEDLKATLSNMNRSSLLLTEDLEALQHNFLFRGFFRRRAKAEAKAREEAELNVTEVHPTPDR